MASGSLLLDWHLNSSGDWFIFLLPHFLDEFGVVIYASKLSGQISSFGWSGLFKVIVISA